MGLFEMAERAVEARRQKSQEQRAYAPHCDPSVLHSPGTCDHCDKYPDWQEYRVRARINFTNTADPGLAPCPATYYRPVERIERWYGNVPSKEE